MTFTSEQIGSLSAKLSSSHVKERKQAGRNLSYIEGWVAISEANRIFGFDAWDRELVDLRQLGQPYKNANGNIVINYSGKVRVTVRAGDAVVVREGCGFGSGIDKDEGQAHESAIKECETDSMKRALMTFGNPFGLALYDKSQENVEAAPQSKPDKAAPGQANTASLTPEQRATAWVESARRAIEGIQAPEAYMEWKNINDAALAKLEANYPDKYEALQVFIDGKRGSWAEKF
jgi:DNA repair and recombination protein RAD52